MSTPAPKELAREYRVAQQTLAMHADLRDHYARLGLGIEILLLAFTALISTTTFAADDFYNSLHVAPGTGRLLLGLASAVAFAGSLVLLLLDPRGKAATHTDLASKWSGVVLKFRQHKREDGTWPPEIASELADAYVEACDTCSPIPERKFNRLKSRYLRKVQVSQMKDRHPSCPIIILGLLCRLRDTHAAIKAFRSETSTNRQYPTTEATDGSGAADRGISDGP